MAVAEVTLFAPYQNQVSGKSIWVQVTWHSRCSKARNQEGENVSVRGKKEDYPVNESITQKPTKEQKHKQINIKMAATVKISKPWIRHENVYSSWKICDRQKSKGKVEGYKQENHVGNHSQQRSP